MAVATTIVPPGAPEPLVQADRDHEAALPASVPLFRRAGEARSQLAELRHSGAPAEETRAHWGQIEALAAEAKADFPLSGDECADLRKDLQARVLSLYEGEAAALKEMTRIID